MIRCNIQKSWARGSGLALLAMIAACGGNAVQEASPDPAVTPTPPGVDPGVCPLRPDDLTAESAKQWACGGSCQPAQCQSGACTPELVLEDAEGPTVLAVDESGLYWAAQVSADDATEALSVIRHLPAQGDYVDLTTVDGIVGGLTTHGSRLYWTVERRVGETRTNSVQSMSLLGGGAAISSFETHGGSAYGIAIRDDRAYWADFYTGVFTTTTASGLLSGDAHYLTGWTNARGVTVFDDTLFWTQMNLDNSVRFRSLSQPGKSQLIACGQSWPASVAVDQRRVYWINHYIYDAPAWIAVAERSGGSPRVLLDDRPIGYLASGSLTSDTDHLFWVERDTQIMRMLK